MVSQAMSGRVVAITGANGGIGKYTALRLAEQGAHVVLIARTRERAEEAQAFVTRALPAARTDIAFADLSSLEEVRGLAQTLARSFPTLSVLVNNAGLIAPRRFITKDGFELTFAVNHLAPFVLSQALLPVLSANAPARIVNVNSDAHLSAVIDFANLNAEHSFWPPTAYERSKLANMLFTKELARRLDPAVVTVNALHPGLVATDFGEVGGVVGFGWFFVRPWGISPEDGAKTSVYVASAPELAGQSGGFYRLCRPAAPNPLANDAELARRMWEYSARVTA